MIRKLSLFAAFARTHVKYNRERLFWGPKGQQRGGLGESKSLKYVSTTIGFCKSARFAHVIQTLEAALGQQNKRSLSYFTRVRANAAKSESVRNTLKPYKSIAFYSARCDSVISRKLKCKLQRYFHYCV